jgi:hypothetical protein
MARFSLVISAHLSWKVRQRRNEERWRERKRRKRRLTVSHLPPDNISVTLLAILGFSATHSTFIFPHILSVDLGAVW